MKKIITTLVALLITTATVSIFAETVKVPNAGKLGHNVDVYYQSDNLNKSSFKMLTQERVDKLVNGIKTSESYTKYGYEVRFYQIVDTKYIKDNYGSTVAEFMTDYKRLDIRNKVTKAGWVIYQMVNDMDNPENNKWLVITIVK